MEANSLQKGPKKRSRNTSEKKVEVSRKKKKGEVIDNMESADQGSQEYLTKFFPNFLEAIKECIKETNIKCIDVGNLNLGSPHLEAIFNVLLDSQVTEFLYENSTLQQLTPGFDELLKKSKLQKLSFKGCNFHAPDLLTLVAALQKTQVKDLDLSRLSLTGPYTSSVAKTIFKDLKSSHLTHLRLSGSPFFGHSSGKDLISQLPHTSITHLSLNGTGLSKEKNVLKNLFTVLPETCITDLYVGSNEILDDELKLLYKNLKKSKLETLDLSSNKITDTGANLLFEALVGSKLSVLFLSRNHITGSNNLGKHLKKTMLTKLHLGYNKIENSDMFCFPEFLKDTALIELHLNHCNLGEEVALKLVKCLESSKVSKVDLSGNLVGLQTVTNFANIVSKTEIVEVDFSENVLSVEMAKVLGECIQVSKLQHLKLKGSAIKLESLPVATLLEKSKGTSLKYLDISNTNFEEESALLTTSLKNTSLTHLNLSSCLIGAALSAFAPILKHTEITHLNLSENQIDDAEAVKLAYYLKETKIIQLEIKNNLLGNEGAEALSVCLKSGPMYNLNLSGNKITNAGIQKLATALDTTYITSLDVSNNAGDRVLPLETVLRRNRILLYQLVSFFVKIAPTEGSKICFRKASVNPKNKTAHIKYFNECLQFYQNITEKPSAISALASDKSSCFSRDKIAKIVEDFPSQFISFVVENHAYQLHIKVLERAQTLKLEKISTCMLNEFAASMLKDRKGILMPEAFRLFEKYKQAMADVVSAPEDKEAILNKFVERPICGLCGKQGSLTRLDCCDRWLCDGEDLPLHRRYVQRSCSGNHDKYSQCSAHYNNGHRGDYHGCRECIEEFDADEDDNDFMYDF